MRATILIFAVLGGCAEPSLNEGSDLAHREGDAAGSYTPGSVGCSYDYAAVDADYVGDKTDGGLVAAVAIDAMTGPHAHVLQWDASLATTGVTLELASPHAITLVSSSDSDCEPKLDLESMLSIATDDGALDELLPVTIQYTGEDFVRLNTWIAFDQLEGFWEPEQLRDQSWDSVDVEFMANIGRTGSAGEIALYAESASRGGHAWDSARWPAP